MQLARFPRIHEAHLPTPLEKLQRLSNHLNNAEIWIKRDDCTGLSTGGNKTRKLEFLMAEAKAQGANLVITQGATQSNHARQTAAFAAKLGMACHILLEDRTGSREPNYNFNGNVLLDFLHGATVEKRPNGSDMNKEMQVLADKFTLDGRNVYIIPGGGSNSIGALGYVNCAQEMVAQFNDRDLCVDQIIHATGSTGTQAGLVAGLKMMNTDIPVLGISVRASKNIQEENVFKLAEETTHKFGVKDLIKSSDICVSSDYVGEGYGLPTPEGIEAIRMFAEYEGILLDPVYSAKAAAGLIDFIRKGRFTRKQKLVFLHTGGSASLFGYMSSFQNESKF